MEPKQTTEKKVWKTHTSCPLCGGRIGIIDGIKAPTPLTIRCPGCRKWLRVELPGLLNYTLAIGILILLLTIGGISIAIISGGTRLILYMLFFFGFGLLLDICFSLFFFTYGRLTPFQKPQEPIQ